MQSFAPSIRLLRQPVCSECRYCDTIYGDSLRPSPISLGFPFEQFLFLWNNNKVSSTSRTIGEVFRFFNECSPNVDYFEKPWSFDNPWPIQIGFFEASPVAKNMLRPSIVGGGGAVEKHSIVLMLLDFSSTHVVQVPSLITQTNDMSAAGRDMGPPVPRTPFRPLQVGDWRKLMLWIVYSAFRSLTSRQTKEKWQRRLFSLRRQSLTWYWIGLFITFRPTVTPSQGSLFSPMVGGGGAVNLLYQITTDYSIWYCVGNRRRYLG